MYARDNVAGEAERLLQLPGDWQVDAATGMLRLLADGTRLRLMWLLCHAEHDVTSLTAAVGVARPSVSQHLAKLRLGGLVGTRRAGRRVVYTARDGHIRRLVIEALHAAGHEVPGRAAGRSGLAAPGPAAPGDAIDVKSGVHGFRSGYTGS